MNGAELFVRALENEGVQYVFGLPGEENLEVLEALRKSNIKFIGTRHEQAAGFMAATFGRLTGHAGVCMTTLGPGATNLVTAALHAQLGGMPMVLITGQKPIKTNKQGHFQIVNTVNLFQGITKHAKQVVDSHAIPAMVREAFRVAEEERPGVAHIEIPKDISREIVDAPLFEVTRPRRPMAEEKAIREAVWMIERAHRPLVLVGAGANRKRVSSMIAEFVEKTGIPFFNTQMGKGVVDERHPLYLGTAAVSDHDFIHEMIKHADLIINIGHDIVEKPPFLMRHGGTKVIHVNFYSAKVDEIYFPQLEVVGDIANAVWQMKERLEPQTHWHPEVFLAIQKKLHAHIKAKSWSTQFHLFPQRIVAEVRRAMPQDGIVALDNGMFKIWFARNYPAYEPNTLLLDNALATMGAGLPAAMAARLVYPEKKIVAVCGDGGFMMSGAEIETAVRLNLNLVVLIINDGAFGMIKWEQELEGLDNFGLTFKNPDFVRYAESFGAKGYRVKKVGDLGKLLKSCLHEKGVHIVDVPVDYRENKRIFFDELKKKVKE